MDSTDSLYGVVSDEEEAKRKKQTNGRPPPVVADRSAKSTPTPGVLAVNVDKPADKNVVASNESIKKKAAEKPAAKSPTGQPIIDPNMFAYREGEMQKVGDLRQKALQGFSGGEIAKRREGFQQPIESNRLAALRSLGRQQVHSGVKGGIAYAQTKDINQQSARASANAGRDLFLANEDYKRQALGDLQGFLGKERYGQFASTLAGKQLGVQQEAAGNQNQQMQQLLQFLQSRGIGQLYDPTAAMTGPIPAYLQKG